MDKDMKKMIAVMCMEILFLMIVVAAMMLLSKK